MLLRNTILFLALALAALLTTGCCMILPLGSCSSDSPLVVDMIFHSLNDNRIPLDLSDDGKKKDVKSKDRVTFKPATGVSGATKKRFKMVAEKDNAAASHCFGRQMKGDSTTWVRVSVHKKKGLEDGVSAALLRRVSVSGSPPVQVEAVWNASINGLTARARVNGGLLGGAVDFPNLKEVFLFLEASGTGLVFSCADAVGEEYNGYGSKTTLLTLPIPADDIYKMAFGVDGLSKKGAFYFAHFTVRMGALPTAGDEVIVGTPIVESILNLKNALYQLTWPSPHNLYGLKTLVATTGYKADHALTLTKDADKSGGLDVTTDVKALKDTLKGLAKDLLTIEAKIDHLIKDGKTNGKTLVKKLEEAEEQFEVALGQLLGYQKSSSKGLEKTIEIKG